MEQLPEVLLQQLPEVLLQVGHGLLLWLLLQLPEVLLQVGLQLQAMQPALWKQTMQPAALAMQSSWTARTSLRRLQPLLQQIETT